MEFVSNYKPRKSCLKNRDKRPWDGDEEGVEPGNVEADLFEQATLFYYYPLM